MKITLNELPVNNGSIRTFLIDGKVNVNAEGLEQFIVLENFAVAANSFLVWRSWTKQLSAYRLLSLWVSYTGSATGTITLNVKDGLGNTQASLQLTVANANGYQFPLVLVSESGYVEMVSTQALTKVTIFAKHAYISDVISPG